MYFCNEDIKNVRIREGKVTMKYLRLKSRKIKNGDITRKKRLLQKKQVICGGVLLAFLFLFTGASFAEIIPRKSWKAIVDSKDISFACRVYAYDLGIDSKGNVHIVYSNPTLPDCSTSQIRYVSRVNGVWNKEVPISNNGLGPNVSTRLAVGADDTVHICYIGVDNDPQHPHKLHYITVAGGEKGEDIIVDRGGWHTRIQLDENDHPIFIREGRTYPEKVSELTLHTTTDNLTWVKQHIDVPNIGIKRFRLANFIYQNGIYHLTYGGFEHTKKAWDSKRMKNRVDGSFHKLHYASSTDGVTWNTRIIDDSKKLREIEFWTSLVVDGNRPIVSRYRYEEMSGRYNLGTSANFMTPIGGSEWMNKIITDTSYPEFREGMGVGLLVNNPGDYFSVWEFSPPKSPDAEFDGNGNIALYRNGPKNDWSLRGQVAPFSMEGRGILRKKHNKIFLLVLGDYVDTKLYFFEYDLKVLNKRMPPRVPRSGGNGLNQGVSFLLLGQVATSSTQD